MSKSRLNQAVRAWDAKQVADVLNAKPELAALLDEAGRTLLHNCARFPVARKEESAASIATARALLAAGVALNAIQAIKDDGEIFPATALWYALAWGRNRPLAAFLLRSGAHPNHCMFALAYADDLASAKLVRRHGADLEEVFGGETALTYALRHRRATFSEWLLKEGARANTQDRHGLTPLHHAVRRRLPDSTLRALRNAGANTRAVAADGTTVAQLATRLQRRTLGIERDGARQAAASRR